MTTLRRAHARAPSARAERPGPSSPLRAESHAPRCRMIPFLLLALETLGKMGCLIGTTRSVRVYARPMRARGVYQDGMTATAGGWRSAATWLGVLVVACGRPDGQGSPPRPRPEAAPVVTSGWTRDPATGECGPYTDRDGLPDGGPLFDSYIECRCSVESCPSTIDEAGQRLCAVTSPPANVQRFVGCGVMGVVDYSGNEWIFEQPSESGGSGTAAPRLIGVSKVGAASSFDAGATSFWSAGYQSFECDYEREDEPLLVCHLCGEDRFAGTPPC